MAAPSFRSYKRRYDCGVQLRALCEEHWSKHKKGVLHVESDKIAYTGSNIIDFGAVFVNESLKPFPYVHILLGLMSAGGYMRLININ